MKAWRKDAGSDSVLSYLLFLISALRADSEAAAEAEPLADVHGRLKQAKRDREDAWEPVAMGRGRVQFHDHRLNRVVQKFWLVLGAGLEWLREKLFALPPSVTTRGMADAQRDRVENLLGEARPRQQEAEEVAEYVPRVEGALSAVETARSETKTARSAWRDAFRVERMLRDDARVLVRKTYGRLIDRFPRDPERVESYFPTMRDVRPSDEDEVESEETPELATPSTDEETPE